MTDQAIVVPRRTSAVERYLAAETRLWQHYGLLPEGAVRGDRPAASEASRAGGWNGSAGAVPPRHRRSGIVAVAGRGHAGLPVSPPRSSRMGSQHAGGLSARRVSPVCRGPARCIARFARHRPGRRGRRVDRRRVGAQPGRTPSNARRSGRAPRRRADRRRCPRAEFHPGAGLADRRSHRPAADDRDRLLSILRGSGHTASLEDGRVADELVAGGSQPATTQRRCVTSVTWSAASSAGRVGGRASCSTRASSPASKSRRCSSTGPPTRPAVSRSGGVSRTTCPTASCRSCTGAGHHPWFEDAQGVAERVQGFLARSAGDPAPLEAAYAGRSRSAGPM